MKKTILDILLSFAWISAIAQQNVVPKDTSQYNASIWDDSTESGVVQRLIGNQNTPGYLIITVPKYLNAVNKFTDWKRTLGFNVRLVCQNSWNEASISTAISNESIYDIKYLLIVGDFADVPGKYTSNTLLVNGNYVSYNFYTDYYYGCIGNSSTPAMARGRLSVSTAAEAMTVIDKIINYERDPVNDSLFYNTAVNCTCFIDDNNDGRDDDICSQITEEITVYMTNHVGKNIHRVYYAPYLVSPIYWYDGSSVPSELLKSNGFAWNGNSANISNHINSGVFYALHESHGNYNHWGYPYFYLSSISNLTNGNKLPVVFSMNCLTGKYNMDVCFAESFLRKQNGGCVAIIAPSEETCSGYDEALTTGMFDAIWPGNGYFKSIPYGNPVTLYSTPTYRLGDVLDVGLANMQTIIDYNDNHQLKHTKETYHLFGDPAMEIFTANPTPFSNVTIERNNNYVHVSLLEEARISFYNTSSGLVESIYDTNASYPDASDLRICVSKHNKIPLIIDKGVLFLQNGEIASSVTYKADTIKVGTNITNLKSAGEFVVKGGNTILQGEEVILNDETTISANAQFEMKN